MIDHPTRAAVLRDADLRYADEDGCRVSTPLRTRFGAAQTVRVPRGGYWKPETHVADDVVVVVCEGTGHLATGAGVCRVMAGSTAFAAAGDTIAAVADDGDLALHVWHTQPAPGRADGAATPFNTVYDVTGMPHGPANGCHTLRVESYIATPGTVFEPLEHQDADVALFALEGRGQFLVDGRWWDVAAGDCAVLRAGTRYALRNPDTSTAAPLFVAIGGQIRNS